MSLDVFREHRLEQLANGPFSEEWTTDGGATIKGIYDNSPESTNKDAGNYEQKTVVPRIITATIPDGVERGTVVLDVQGRDMTVSEISPDYEGVPVIWLY